MSSENPTWEVIRLANPETVEISLEQFLASIEKNGLPQTTHMYWDKDKVGGREYVTSACAIGQAALNLGVEFSALEYAVGQKFRTKGRRSLSASIVGRNDGNGWSYKTIARYYRRMFADRLNETVTVNRTFRVKKG